MDGPDPLRPARGIFNAVAFSLAVWAALGLLLWWWLA